MEKITSKSGSVSFPYQKRSISQKGEAFMKSCVDSGIDMTVLNNDDDYRSDRQNKIINYDLANGIIDKKDMFKITNPFGIDGLNREIQDYPLVRPRLNILIGEESNRKFDFQCRVVNEDAISYKEQFIKERYLTQLKELIFTTSFNEEEAKKKVQELEKWRKYESQDLRERTASQILDYLWHKLNLKSIFNAGMEDALISGEEIYKVDIVGGDPIVRRISPLNLFIARSSSSNRIDDADIIVEDGYHNVGSVIDNFYEHLSDADISDIERGSSGINSPSRAEFLNYSESEPYPVTGNFIDIDTETVLGNKTIDRAFDDHGNIRVTTVTWRSLRKIGILESYDEEGYLTKTYVDEFYKEDKAAGQKIKWVWINEWWEGTRIGKDIYVNMGPKPVQFRGFGNQSYSGSGYIGTLYNINGTKTRSLMDIMKPYQYLYDEFMERVKSAFAKFKGPMIELDFAKMPDGWEPEKWMHYAENMGYLIVDSFKEGTKGQSKGKLAGGFNTTGKVLNPDLGNYIQHHVLMLNYIEKQIGVISGIPDQRLGEINKTETVGGVERAINQSSHITETIFSLHDETKVRVLEALLNTAKYAWRNDKKKIQYVLDDMAHVIINFDGGLINEAEYGIFVTDGRSSVELIQMMKQLAHAGLQTDKIDFSGILDIYTSSSISSMRRKIEEKEEQAYERMKESNEANAKAQQEAVQAQREMKMMELEQKERENIRDNQTKIAIAMGSTEDTDDGKIELEKKKQSLAEEKQKADIELNKRKIAETERSNRAKESIAKSKKASPNK